MMLMHSDLNLLHNLILALATIACAPQLAHCQDASPIHVVLLSGQSNMAGKGSFNQLSEADQARVKAISSRVMISENGAAAKPLGVLPARSKKGKQSGDEVTDNNVDASGSRKAGKADKKVSVPKDRFGPEMFIAVTLAETNPDQKYLLVKYSMGGTSLYGAWNSEWSLEKSQAVEKGERKQQVKLYAEHITAINQNLDELESQDKQFAIIGMAWMQGENDAAKEISATSYEANLQKLIAAYRTEFKLPEMPVVCGQINSNYGNFPAGPDMVRAAFVIVADADPNVAVIRTMKERPPTDFPKVDGAHYNAEGQKRLGTAMANAIIEMQ